MAPRYQRSGGGRPLLRVLTHKLVLGEIFSGRARRETAQRPNPDVELAGKSVATQSGSDTLHLSAWQWPALVAQGRWAGTLLSAEKHGFSRLFSNADISAALPQLAALDLVY